MKAIQVKYLPATNTKPSRLKAMAEGVKPLTQSFSGMEDAAAQARPHVTPYHMAAQLLCQRMNWNGELVGGGLPDGSWAFCFVDSRD